MHRPSPKPHPIKLPEHRDLRQGNETNRGAQGATQHQTSAPSCINQPPGIGETIAADISAIVNAPVS